MCGIVEGLRKYNLLSSGIQLIAVETVGADCFHHSIRQGRLVTLDRITSIAKTLGAKRTVESIFNVFQRNNAKDRMFVVSDEDTVKAMTMILDNEKILVEPACACNVAALLKNKELFRGKKLVVIMCGANTNVEEYLKWRKTFNLL